RCGSWVVRLAAGRGHDVRAVVRPSSSYRPPPGVAVARGEVLDPRFVEEILPDHPLVISCIGQRRASPSPWSALRSPPDLVKRVMTNVVRAMSQKPGHRILWISAAGVGSSRARTTPAVRRIIDLGNIAVAYRDLEAAERVTDGAEVESLAVRPVTLRPGSPGGDVGPVDRYGLLSTIRRGDVARWILDVADGTRAFQGRTVLLGRIRTRVLEPVPFLGRGVEVQEC
ncbi:MAG: NAD(P)H-binding protein, partial [Gammaproteobacteria bacterium]|nr:NAD(P)H-binding protein [Gemmatimonadota bacterium]NIT89441.1 NAD(P)H-binding protein [Gemmatimonadota bacterium]NIU75919.1 NAD(P)H-binding protein [Gammaproteobacteria bacterium]NIX41573.1 NAD(P)H-binding protein [Gemmatimonadota bacterium]